MSEPQKGIGGKHESLLMKYATLPLKSDTAKEYATHGFPRACEASIGITELDQILSSFNQRVLVETGIVFE